MRHKHTAQGSIFWFRPEHEIRHILDRVDEWLTEHPELLSWIADDLGQHDKGRCGLSCEQVLRTAIIKQYRQCSYRELVFMLTDSLSFQHFSRVDPFNVPSKSALQSTISRVKETTWEKMNQLFVRVMIDSGFESNDRLRIDSTVAESHILSPTDNKLLYDCVRVMVRMLKHLKPETNVKYVNHCRRAKRNYYAAHCAKNDDSRCRFYKALLKDVDSTRVSLYEALEVLKKQGYQQVWVEEIETLLPLVAQVMNQTTRRVIELESVPATEKIVSLFEPTLTLLRRGDVQSSMGIRSI
jgi:IS5 family transposase